MTRAVLPVLAIALGAATALAQQTTFKVSVDLVSVDVLVSARGVPIPDLTAADFQLVDNNVPQKIESISSAGPTTASMALRRVPLDVVLVFDVSGSVAGDKLAQLVEAGKAVLAALRPDDRAALVTFSHRAAVRHPLTPDVAPVSREVERLFLSAGGRTSLFDALYTGLSLRRASDTRALVLVFSDGRDNSSWLSSTQLSQVVRESDVVVYAVGLDDGVKGDLKEIAEETGGTALVAQSTKELKTLFARIVREMQARYVLNYYPAGVTERGWHAIQVRVPGRRAEVVARRGYWRR